MLERQKPIGNSNQQLYNLGKTMVGETNRIRLTLYFVIIKFVNSSRSFHLVHTEAPFVKSLSNPIADLTVTEIYEFLRFLNAPACIIEKAPPARIFDGQTDESKMGFTGCLSNGTGCSV